MQLSEILDNRFTFFQQFSYIPMTWFPRPWVEKNQNAVRSRKVTTRPGVGKAHNTSSCREKSQRGLRSRKITTRPGVGKSHNASSCREKITTLAGEHGCGLCGLLLEGSEMSLQRFFGYVLRARLVNLQFSKTAFFLKRGATE